jgi:hypothetical protein
LETLSGGDWETWGEPGFPIFFTQDDGHAVVAAAEGGIRLGGEDAVGIHTIPVGQGAGVPQSGKDEGFSIREAELPGLLRFCVVLSFVESIRRDEAALLFQGVAEGGLLRGGL